MELDAERLGRARELARLIRRNIERVTVVFAEYFQSKDRESKDRESIENCVRAVADVLDGITVPRGRESDLPNSSLELKCRTGRLIEVAARIRTEVVNLLEELVPELAVDDVMLVLAAIDSSAIALCWKPDRKLQNQENKLRLLLAEDTLATRSLLLSAFDSERYAIDVAVNGLDALECFQQSSYDVVLTDVQMPVLDGLTATQRMRSLETEQPWRGRTPIIAITAGDSETERATCLNAGMDAFLPKPIDLPRLFDTILRVAERSGLQNDQAWAEGQVRHPGPSKEPESTFRSFNISTALNRLQGDESLFRALVEFFLDDYAELLDQIRVGIQKRDGASIRRGSHALKGMASGLSATPVVTITEGIEAMARDEKIDEVSQMVGTLELEASRLVLELKSFLVGIAGTEDQ